MYRIKMKKKKSLCTNYVPPRKTQHTCSLVYLPLNVFQGDLVVCHHLNTLICYVSQVKWMGITLYGSLIGHY